MTAKSFDRKERTVVFPGSFNPYTAGHDDIVRRALAMFDRVIICVGVNPAKADAATDAEARVAAIRGIYAGDSRVSVERWGGLTSDFVRQRGAAAILRGVRSVKDFEYERDIADANKALAGVETVVMYADPSKAWLSSSLVRELASYGPVDPALLPGAGCDEQQI